LFLAVAQQFDFVETLARWLEALGLARFRLADPTEADMLNLTINGRTHTVGDDVDPQTPLLWVLRDTLGLVGTKYGCGVGQCSACTVHLNGSPIQSCQVPASAAVGQQITTVEGLAAPGAPLTAVQQAWIEEDVAQCGYCQAGQIMRATALLARNPKPTDDDIDRDMAANLCRCGTYTRIRKAIHSAAAKMAKTGGAR
jgi:isoquinoline 1-oxidoreductase alpha subunit